MKNCYQAFSPPVTAARKLSSCLQVILHRTKDTKRTPSEQSKELTKKIAAERISVFIFFKAKVPIKFYGHIFHMPKFFVLQKNVLTAQKQV